MPQTFNASTLSAYRQSGTKIFATCTSCRYSDFVDLDTLIARYGEDCNFIQSREEIRQSLSCSKCGNRAPEIQIAAPTKG